MPAVDAGVQQRIQNKRGALLLPLQFVVLVEKQVLRVGVQNPVVGTQDELLLPLDRLFMFDLVDRVRSPFAHLGTQVNVVIYRVVVKLFCRYLVLLRLESVYSPEEVDEADRLF